MEIKNVTNVIFIKDNKVLLGMKKRGFGKGKYNGFGGKQIYGETIEETALREAKEEVGLTMKDYYKASVIKFNDSYPLIMHVYVCTAWEGSETESDEMLPLWFTKNTIPFSAMWEDDKYWFNIMLDGKKFIASFNFENNNDLDGTAINKVKDYSLKFVTTLI